MSFAHFKIGLFGFVVELKGSFMYSGYEILIRFAKFPPIFKLSFHFLKNALVAQKFLVSMNPIYLFIFCCFLCHA